MANPLKLFSPLEQLIRGANVKKALPAEGWQAQISPKPGRNVKIEGMEFPITPDDYKFSGIEDFLARSDAPVTKDDLLNAIESNRFSTLSKTPVNSRLMEKYGDPAAHEKYSIGYDQQNKPYHDYEENLSIFDPDKTTGDANYIDWDQLDLGRAHVEVPAELREDLDYARSEGMTPLEAVELYSDEELLNQNYPDISDEVWENYINSVDYLKDEISKPLNKLQYNPPSVHRLKPNTVIHSRANRRTSLPLVEEISKLDDLRSTRHIEEIQSDWHQQGSKKGYKKSFEELTPEQQSDFNRMIELEEKGPRTTREERDDYMVLQAKYKVDDSDELIGKQGVPQAPFRKNWIAPQLKRELSQAIESGDDFLTWTTGSTQNNRWSGSDANAVGRTYDKDIPKEAAKIARKYGADPKEVISTRKVASGFKPLDRMDIDQVPQSIIKDAEEYDIELRSAGLGPVGNSMELVERVEPVDLGDFTAWLEDFAPDVIDDLVRRKSIRKADMLSDDIIIETEMPSMYSEDIRRSLEDLAMGRSTQEEVFEQIASSLDEFEPGTQKYVKRKMEQIEALQKDRPGTQYEEVHALEITPEMKKRYYDLKNKTGAGFSMYKMPPIAIGAGLGGQTILDDE